MESNNLVLNPGADATAHPICPNCEEKIVELSTGHENRFTCGCNQLIEFDIPVEKTGELEVNDV